MEQLSPRGGPAPGTGRGTGPDPSRPDWLLERFGTGETAARTAYRRFMREGMADADSPWDRLKGGIVLGSDAFLERLRLPAARAGGETPRRQRHAGRPSLAALRQEAAERGAWMAVACDEHGYTLAEIAAEAGLHYSSVSKIVKAWREGRKARSSQIKT